MDTLIRFCEPSHTRSGTAVDFDSQELQVAAGHGTELRLGRKGFVSLLATLGMMQLKLLTTVATRAMVEEWVDSIKRINRPRHDEEWKEKYVERTA